MRKLIFLIPLLFLGCRTYQWVHITPDKIDAWTVTSFISNARLGKLILVTDTNTALTVEDYSQTVDAKTVSAISEGVTTAVIKSLVP